MMGTLQAPHGQTASSPLAFSRFTATNPSILTKQYCIADDGTLRKEAAAQMVEGTVEVDRIENIGQFAAVLDELTSAQAVGYGLPIGLTRARIVTAATLRKGDHGPSTIARTREHFAFAPQPGILMLDHDEHLDGPLDAEGLYSQVVEMAPVLKDAPMLWRPSASAGIRRVDGTLASSSAGARLYIPLSDATLIPEAGRAIVELLWAKGIGWCRVSSAGSLLNRTIVDAAVWQPERLDFAGPVVLGDGLTRDAPTHRLFGPANAVQFDGSRILDLVDGEVRAAAKKHRETARTKIRGEAERVRESWIEVHAPALAAERGIDVERATDVLRRAARDCILYADFVLVCQNGARVTVGELLDNRERWHGKRFADPLEPTYANDARIAVAILYSGGRPTIYSHAHGGQRFRLARSIRRVLLATGERARAVDDVLAVLRDGAELVEYGGALARIEEGRAMPVNDKWLIDHLDREIAFYAVRRTNAAIVEVPRNTPADVVASVLAKTGARGLPAVDAVVTAPTLRADGSILDRPGHDECSRLLYAAPADAPLVQREVSPAQALDALRILWRPIAAFPFVDDIDRGVALAALITACLRASLPASPGFGIDAPAAGTGKTLFAKVAGVLATGDAPAALPPVGERDDEMRKRLFAALREGRRVLLWDNVRDLLGGAALDAFLTAPTFADRVLGASEVLELPNRALVLATGNNLRLVGDTCRRVLIARLDAKVERPYSRTFEIDPVQFFIAHRMKLVIAALSIVRGWITAGRPQHAKGDVGSFREWGELVRQPVAWIASITADHADLPALGDPLLATDRAFAADPDTAKLGALLDSWHRTFEDKPTPVRDVIRYIAKSDTVFGDNQKSAALADAVDEIAGERGRPNVRILGRWIERNAGRRLDGRWFEAGTLRDGYKRWIVRNDGFDRKKPPETRSID